MKEGFDFGKAIRYLKEGKMVARQGWNSKGMWLKSIKSSYYTTSESFNVNQLLPWIFMKTADDKLVPWLASQIDMFAEDWQLVE